MYDIKILVKDYRRTEGVNGSGPKGTVEGEDDFREEKVSWYNLCMSKFKIKNNNQFTKIASVYHSEILVVRIEQIIKMMNNILVYSSKNTEKL